MPITRRDFVKGAGVGAGSLALGVSGAPAAAETPTPQSTARRLRCLTARGRRYLSYPSRPYHGCRCAAELSTHDGIPSGPKAVCRIRLIARNQE